MNPALVKVGIGVFFGAAVLLIQWWKSKRIQDSSHSRVNCGNFDGSSINICCICMGEFKNVVNKHEIFVLECRHKFHKECIKMLWAEGGSRKTCPLCRKIISKAVASKIVESS